MCLCRSGYSVDKSKVDLFSHLSFCPHGSLFFESLKISFISLFLVLKIARGKFESLRYEHILGSCMLFFKSQWPLNCPDKEMLTFNFPINCL